ncbi:N-succinyl-L,L-diaminopimelate desuccinylase [Labilithrix luteola]|uniref:Succinyl-diaminopimelate desuccinylase n=1 Tax=Labilithrix luteola TaxID=1391654 RepID=A0A0K1QD74_9BACT|nr:succinyl-diaminopimelate desuccinylase [Labilithrix luteola]AKV03683.1 N-succinyl-L,L-diaminopimelate desuccinylase [Labilithrix luteola]
MSTLPDTLSTRTPTAIALEETLLWLCSIASPIGEENALCNAVKERLERVPLAGPIRRYGDSIVVPLVRSGTGRPHVALVGHLDTVRTENGPARIDGDRCFGAGAADMKSGLAIMIVVAETMRESLACDLTLVFYAREEGPYAENELGPVLDADPELSKVDLAVCLEPSDNKLHLGCCGAIHATVTFQGRTAHSARPWEGENAITKAAGLLERLAALKPIEHRIEGMVYRTVTTVTLANGGRGRNVVPDTFTLNLNHRFAPNTSLEQAQRDVLALVGEGARVEFTDLSPAAMPSAEHPLVQKLMACGVRGVEPKQAWTDVARFSSLGVPAINFGPGENAQAHQKNESTDLGLVFQGYKIFHSWLSQL